MRRLFLLAALACAPALRAQAISIYGTFAPLHASNVQTGSVYTTAGYQEQYTSFFTPAFGGGVTFGILPIGPVHIGFDLRGSTHRGTVGADTAMGGLRLGFKPPLLPIKPYVQASVGYLATRTVNVSSTTNVLGATTVNGGTFGNQYLAYEGIAGLDYRFDHFIDLRVIEVGAGQGINVFGSNSSSTTTPPSSR